MRRSLIFFFSSSNTKRSMLRYGYPTLMKSDSKWHKISRKRSKAQSVKQENNLTYETLRLQTLEFLKNPDFETRTFDRLEKSIKKLIYRDKSYPCAILLELLYCCKYSYLENSSIGFGATISHELDTDESLVVDGQLFLPQILELDPLEYARVKRYELLLPLLYKGKIYKILNDPWLGWTNYSERLYNGFVLKFHEQNFDSCFKNKRIYVHINSTIYKFLNATTVIDSENIKNNFSRRILELPKGKSFIYVTVCSLRGHEVTLVMRLKKQSEHVARLSLFFVENNVKGSFHYDNVQKTEQIKKDLYEHVLDHLRSMNVESIKLQTEHEIIYPENNLNFGIENRFAYDGYCLAVSIVLVYVILQYYLNYDIDQQFEKVDHICRTVQKECLAMKRVVIDDRNLWFFFVKSCILTMFIKHYDLNGDKALKDQRAFLDIWSDKAFPPSYYTNEGWERVNSVNESRSYSERYPFPTLLNNNNLNLYYVKLSYMVVQDDCAEALFGIALCDETSYTDTISKPVNSNGVKYYVINRTHYDDMFSRQSEQNSLEYNRWVEYVRNGMEIEFASFSGKEMLTLTRDGIIRNGQLCQNFHFIGIRKFKW